MSNITFILFAKNEEARISYTIRNLKPYGEIFVLDDGSTDRTKEISESLGAKFVVRPKSDKAYAETPEMFAFVKNLAKTDWVYWGYVDNLLPKTLLEKLKEISKQQVYKYVSIPLYTYLWGDISRPMLKSMISCFFRKDSMDFSNNNVHGMGKFTGKKEDMLKLPMKDGLAIRHFSLYDLNKFILGHLRYANEEAKFRFSQGQKFSKIRMFGSMCRYFFLFFRYGFREKDKGVLVSLIYSFFRLMVFFRVYELEQGLDLETIEADFCKAKEEILKDFYV